MIGERSVTGPWPTPSDLVNSPELATLGMVRDTLSMLERVLASAYPELVDGDVDDDDSHRSLPPAALVADRVLSLAIAMNDAVDEYRCTVVPSRRSPPDDESPF